MRSRPQFMAAAATLARSLHDFHERWGFGSFNEDTDLKALFEESRHAILDEEVREFKEAVAAGDFEHAAEEAADVLFVAMGHLEAMGLKLALEGMGKVTQKNDAKVEATHAIRPDTGKLLPLDRLDKWAGAEAELEVARERRRIHHGERQASDAGGS